MMRHLLRARHLLMAHRSLIRRTTRHGHAFRLLLALLLLPVLAACSGQLPPFGPTTPTADARGPLPPTAVAIGLPPAPSHQLDLLALPAAFRYEVTLRPVQADAPSTVISGQYRDGAWAQTSKTGDQPGEELVVARDPATGKLRSFTRGAGDADWTRWPGVTFDAAYGLASPFTVLRLRPLASETAVADAAGLEVTPVPGEVKTQALISAEAVKSVLLAGAVSIATDEDTRAALEQQLAPLFIPQTVTYWTGASGQVLRAAATLLSRGPDQQPLPWVEFTATYSAYDDPAIVIAAPASATDIADLAGRDAVAEQAADVQPGVTLRVRVFATAGVPATDSTVTAYVAGKQTIIAEQRGPDAQFTLKPGVYDLLVRSGGAQQWVKGVTVAAGALASQDVLFEFAQLTVTVMFGATTPAVDVAVYPAGERVNFVGVASLNPARFQLLAGEYDVEAATQDGKVQKRVTGVVVRGGLETALTIDLSQP